MSTDVSAILTAAAEQAAKQKSVFKAVKAGWSACHADPALIQPVFRVWCRAEDYDYHPSGLGGVLARRYKKPSQVAQSLLRAAALYDQIQAGAAS